jgi:outer membrane immunogenic protein
MKRTCLVGAMLTAALGAAPAADLPTKAPILKAAPIVGYDWTGFYAGANWGTAVGTSRLRDNSTLGETGVNEAGFTGGVQAGYNWQFNPSWLFGVEGDFGYFGVDRNFADWNERSSVGLQSSWYGTARARFGYLTGPSLLYLTGGAAFMRVEDRFGGSTLAGIVPTTNTSTHAGWTVGAGIETRLTRGWSAKTEYLYIDGGNDSFAANPFGTPSIANADRQFHVLRSGLNYKFGGPFEGLPFFDPNRLSPVHEWSGFYVGVSAGGVIDLTRVTGGNPAVAPPRLGEMDLNDTGFTGGVQGGYNLMFGPNWFVGIEGDFGYLGLDRTSQNWSDPGFLLGHKTSWLGTLRGRIGTTTGPALLYFTGGGALARVRDTLTETGIGTSSVSKTAGGWTIGGGTEVALDPRWSARLEYLYVDVGSSNHVVPNDTEFADFDRRFQIVRFGLNYRFGASDLLSARY